MSLDVWMLVIAGLALLANVISLATGYYAWTVNRQQARKSEVDQDFVRVHERVDRLQEAHAGLRDQVATNKATLQQLPSAQMVSDLRILVEELRGDVRSLGKELGGFKELSQVMRRQVELIDGYLREGKNG